MPNLSPIIKIAPSKEEKAEAKEFRKQLDFMGSEKMVTPEGGGPKVIASKRHFDHFIGGPLDGHECKHNPNGPQQSWDPGRFWADYYFRDSMHLPGDHRKVEGFHVYSTARAMQYAIKNGIRHKDHANHSFNLGTRGPNMVKLYYYLFFLEDQILYLDGIQPADFKEILTLS